ncbi:hypothetical protein JST97_22780 [bacterium]|nr:hypothetical protein [bacterium]
MSRQSHFAKGQAKGARWLLECRDMWDAFDEDGGVYFVLMMDDLSARREARDIQAYPKDKRLLAAYDLTRPLEEQGAGLNLEDFLERLPPRDS